MQIDRQEQRFILEELAKSYPDPGRVELQNDPEGKRRRRHLHYLQDHGLVYEQISQASMAVAGLMISHGWVATAAGLDFLADDGGLSAVLGVVSVRLHDDTIKDLVAARLQEVGLPEAERKRYLEQLRELPVDATKHLVLKLIDLGMASGDKAVYLIKNVLSSLN